MVRTAVWALNFDADEELAQPIGYRVAPALTARFASLTRSVAGLLQPGDLLLPEIEDDCVPAVPPGALGRAWCPTPRALARLRAAGARPVAAPPVDVLRRVNDRRFSAGLHPALPGVCIATTVDETLQAIAAPTSTREWLLRRPHGFAGRGARVVSHGSHDEAARRWISASIERFGALEIAPRVERTADFALHGYVARTGEVTLGTPTTQTCDARGVWRGSERAAPEALAREETAALLESVEEAASALRSAGYFGPFGIDAFRWRDTSGAPRFCPRSEINARYSMGWATGMGALRPDLRADADEP